ncbi:hypothetical protein MTO96_010538 [Rhipicephalus appendiculatus]
MLRSLDNDYVSAFCRRGRGEEKKRKEKSFRRNWRRKLYSSRIGVRSFSCRDNVATTYIRKPAKPAVHDDALGVQRC